MYTEHAFRKIDEVCPVTLVPSPSSQYADDTTFHANKTWSNLYSTVNQYLLKIIYNSTNLKPNILPSIKKTILGNPIKLLGSLLGSMEDVAARINAGNRAFGTISRKRHSLSSRVNMLSVQIPPVLLYNCGLWTLTSKLSNSLDVWHRRKLRFLLGISTTVCSEKTDPRITECR